MLTLSAFALVAMFAACGGSAKSDAEEVGKKGCECEKLAKDGKVDEAAKCGEELVKMTSEMAEKYKEDSAGAVEFEKALSEYKCE